MRYLHLLTLVLVCRPLMAYQEEPPDPTPIYAEVVQYHIDATLNPQERMVTASQTLTYTNPSPDIIGELRFHLYLNGAKNTGATFYQESLEQGGGAWNSIDENWGYIHIESAAVGDVDRTHALKYVLAPDAAPGDQTVMALPLEEPLLPGQSITVAMNFRARLPRGFERTGFEGNYFFVAQWFPKLGVWESRGQRGAEQAGWNCHAFHQAPEFYANFGSYRVDLRVPPRYVVGATGNLVKKEEGEELTHYRYEENRIHDFAFTASPKFIRKTRSFDPAEHVSEEELAEIMKLHRISREEVLLHPVEMILLIQPEHANQIDRHFQAMILSLKYYGLWYGAYPYQTITMVDPAHGAHNTGGMEYPTFIALGTRVINLESDKDLEDLIIHEFGHQYWYGMVASNEFEEAWLDEGINTYTTGRILDHAYGPTPFHERYGPFRLPLTRWLGIADALSEDVHAASSRQEQGRDPIVQPGWKYLNRGYGANAYSKPATALVQLEYLLGSDTMARIMRTWFSRHAFNHPSTRDFIDVVNEVSGKSMDWFFDELFYKAGQLDYSVHNIRSFSLTEAGYKDGPNGPELMPTSLSDQQRHFVTLLKRGNINYPIELAVTFDDGAEIRLNWDGQGKWKTFTIDDPRSITQAVINPDSKLVIDHNQANNSYRVEPQTRTSRRWSLHLEVMAQHLLQWLAGGL